MKKADIPRDSEGHITCEPNAYALRIETYPGEPMGEDDLYVHLEAIEGDMTAPQVTIVTRLNRLSPPSYCATIEAAQKWARYAEPQLRLGPARIVIQPAVTCEDIDTLH